MAELSRERDSTRAAQSDENWWCGSGASLAQALAERRRQWELFNAWEAESSAKADLLASVEDRMAWYEAAYEFAAHYGDLAAASEEHRRDLIEWVRISRKAWRNLSVSKRRSPE